MKSTCFFTLASDQYYYPVGTHIMVNSFKRFHPDIDLIVFRQDMIDKVMVDGINFYNAKPTFAKLLTDKYDRVINIDADTIILDRLTEIIDTDWEVGAVWNKNDYEDAAFDNITASQYVQAGLVGASNKKFWDLWELENKGAMSYVRQENDTLNLVWYENDETKKMKMLIWDKDKNYLGCKSLGRESEFYMEGKKVMCRGEQVKAYHYARGGGVMPKMDWDRVGIPQDVKQYFNYLSLNGVTEVYSEI